MIFDRIAVAIHTGDPQSPSMAQKNVIRAGGVHLKVKAPKCLRLQGKEAFEPHFNKNIVGDSRSIALPSMKVSVPGDGSLGHNGRFDRQTEFQARVIPRPTVKDGYNFVLRPGLDTPNE